jgi:hypothetical protein
MNHNTQPMKQNNKNRKPKMVQRTTQKTTLRKVVVGSSVLALVLGIFVYLNFSQSDSTMANDISEKVDEVNYRTVATRIPHRLLRSAEINDQLNGSEEKVASGNKKILTRSQDLMIVNVSTQ